MASTKSLPGLQEQPWSNSCKTPAACSLIHGLLSWVGYIARLSSLPLPNPSVFLVKMQLCCGGHQGGMSSLGWPVSHTLGEGGGTKSLPEQSQA